MSVVVIDQQVVHYEVFGRGKPVVFLHGWHGSWRYWYPAIQAAAQSYRTYSFDFWGFGDSRRKSTQPSIQNYSEQVIQFLDAMGIDRAMVVGHSMGGMVGLNTALHFPERIHSVVTVGSPIDGNSLSWLLKLIDRPVLAGLYSRLPWLRRMLFGFFIGQAPEGALREILEDAVKSNANTLQAAIASMWRTDLRPLLKDLRVPTMIIHGGRDDVVHPNQLDIFQNVPFTQPVAMPNSRHFPFLDETELFNQTMMGFLETQALRLDELTLQLQSDRASLKMDAVPARPQMRISTL